MFGSFRSAWFEFRLKRSGDAPAGDCLQSLSGAALQQFFATAQARKAAEILLVSEVADQYLTLLSYDELVAVTQQTLDTAQKSYDLTLLQFHTGTGTELAVSQAQTVVEQARANYSAEVRGRAQAENALVLLLGQPLPADLPPAVPLNSQTLLADIPAGLSSDLLARRPDVLQAEATLLAANANIGAARAAFFPTISLTGDFGTASSSLSGLFKSGSQAWSFTPSISVPIFNAGSLQASLDVAKLQKDIDIAQYEKSDPDGVSRSGRRPGGARHLRRPGRLAGALHAGAAAFARSVGDAIPQRRGQLSDRAHGANRFVQRPAGTGGGTTGSPDQSG